MKKLEHHQEFIMYSQGYFDALADAIKLVNETPSCKVASYVLTSFCAIEIKRAKRSLRKSVKEEYLAVNSKLEGMDSTDAEFFKLRVIRERIRKIMKGN